MKSKITKTFILLITASLSLVFMGCSKDIPDKAQPETPPTSQKATIPAVTTEVNITNPNKIIIANGEWTPYFSENLKHYGIVSHIVTEAFATEGIEVEYQFRPWKRGMEEAAKGRINGTMGWGKKDDRLLVFDYCDQPIMETVSALFYHEDRPFDWNEITDLKDLSISGTVGYFYGSEIEDAEKNELIKINRGPNDDKLNFVKLLSNRTDIAINDLDVGLEIIKDNFSAEEASKIKYHPKNAGSFPCYLLLSKEVEQNKRFLTLFNKGLQKLHDSGKTEQYWKESRAGEYKINE